MNELNLLGKNCKDIVSGMEGICTGIIEWMFGCQQFILQPRSKNGKERPLSCFFYEKQLEIIDEGIREKVPVPEYTPQKYFGQECRDKVTGVVGTCVGRIIWLFNCDQYVLEIQPEDHSKEARHLWLDDGRIEPTEKKRIEPEDVAGSRSGGVLDRSLYPTPFNMSFERNYL